MTRSCARFVVSQAAVRIGGGCGGRGGRGRGGSRRSSNSTVRSWPRVMSSHGPSLRGVRPFEALAEGEGIAALNAKMTLQVWGRGTLSFP